MSTVFNLENKNALNQPMFFGDDLGIARYDIQKYPIFEKLTKKQLSFFWTPEEIKLDKDHRDFKSMNEAEKHIFLSNLKYQTIMDSVNARGPNLALLPYVSLPELEGCILIWSLMESIHSRAYTHIIRNIVKDPSEVFDHILDEEALISRAKSVTRYYDDFIDYARYYKLLGFGVHIINGKRYNINSRKLKQKLYMMLVSIYALESIRFYFSFACSFSFTEQTPAKMEGNTKEISLIARDENIHTAITLVIIKNFMKKENDPEMLEVIKDCEPMVYSLFQEVVEGEEEWGKHLFKYGSILGMNYNIGCAYIKYRAGNRMANLGLVNPYKIKDNSLPWMDNYLNTKNKQVSPQEVEIPSYLIGGINMNVDESRLKKFEF